MQEVVKPARRRVSVAWSIVAALSAVLLVIVAGFAFGVFRLQLFPLPIL